MDDMGVNDTSSLLVSASTPGGRTFLASVKTYEIKLYLEYATPLVADWTELCVGI